MRNLITALLFFGAIFLVWNWKSDDRGSASIEESHVIVPEMFLKRSAVGWEASAPKARPFSAEGISANSPYAGLDPVEAAKNYLETNKANWNLQDHHEIRHSTSQSPLGSTVKFEFAQDGVPITGMYINIDLGKNNEIRSVENLYRPMEQADLKAPMLAPEEITEQLSRRYVSDRGVDTTVLLYAGHQSAKPEPVYSVSATEVANSGSTRRPVKLLVRASDGQVIDVSYERAEFQN
jgi:Zn-dependent metalloprotease